MLEDSSCFKVAVHGIPTADFNTEDDLKSIRTELETFNYGLKLTTDPIWLTPAEKQRDQTGASILVTFQSETEVKKAIQ
jgi:hypothetical protein